jgi:cytochrome P450
MGENHVMIDWSPHAAASRYNPYPIYRRLRDEAPVYHNEELDFYAVSRFDDCWEVLVDHRRFVSSRGVSLEKHEIGMPFVILMDPPVHTWHRKVMSRMFTPRAISALEPLIRTTSATLLDDLLGAETFDFVQDYAMRLPLYVIAELIGLSEDYRLTAQRLSHLAARRTDTKAAPEEATAAMMELREYLLGATADRRKNLGDDIISTIIRTPVVDDEGREHLLDDEQISGFFFELTFAGHDTTTRAIANGVVGLAWYPGQRRELVQRRDLIGPGVEEMLRWDNPSHYLVRVTAEDVELPSGTIPADSDVVVIIASANHDERLYDEPELLDIHRRMDRHLSFGIGPHVCIGASLARLEMRVAFEEFLARFPDFHVADHGCVQAESGQNRGLQNLPIVIDRTAARAVN